MARRRGASRAAAWPRSSEKDSLKIWRFRQVHVLLSFMDGALHISETRHGKILAELAQLGLSLAKDLHARALDAESPEDAAKLATAFHRISRGVRQTLALEAKLMRDEQAYLRDFAEQLDRRRPERVAQRRRDIHQEVERAIWAEYEDPETFHELKGDLHDVLERESRLATFLDEPLAYQLDRLKALFGCDGRKPAEDEEEELSPVAAAMASSGSHHATPSGAATPCEPPAPSTTRSSSRDPPPAD
jgi:hypothetical protein